MEKTVFTIKGILPGEYISNIVEWDLDEGKIEQKDLSYVESSYKGQIWIDGVEIHADWAMKLRPGFSEEKWNFSWGYTSHIVRITSLAICLDLFKDEEIALNLYLPFMHVFLDGLKIESFEKRIDITDFLIDHRACLTGRFFTRYFEFSFFGNHEISIIMDNQTKKFTVNLLDQVCRDLV
ncbi:MAG TPA: hypothetical protein VNX68_06230, partial [Nitrosopumilaceae archaeon]|nr:hypothetical protein [Nitrosopumilaceae archaeon]